MSDKTYGIHWFRRDLRIAGNENLRTNWKRNGGRVLGIFCFDSVFLSRPDFSHNRFAFFLKTLRELKSEMKAQGGDLLVVDALPQNAFKDLFYYLKKSDSGLPNLITYGKDYEPFARNRDENMNEVFQSFGVESISARDHLILEPHEVLKDDGSFYQVYSPFAKKWLDRFATSEGQSRVKSQDKTKSYYEKFKKGELEKIFQLQWSNFKNLPFQDSLDLFENENKKSVTIEIPDAGTLVAQERLKLFKKNVEDYNLTRDLPYLDGTSQLSMYFKNGSLVTSQVVNDLNLANKQFKSPGNSTQYLKEIIWREFYYSILYHRPDVEKQSFLPQYNKLDWSDNKKHFERWCEGQTGFPIVDAGMRQLNTTGWMHNRVRMIVASFLVKDLLINWQWGENYFMKMLLDGDLAPNNGGWQWAASTGCDPQPYFRIFNPWLQAEKFDPEAKYIKTYVPELAKLTPKQIHNPKLLAEYAGYVEPIVEHAIQKEKAVLMFKNAKK